MIEEQTTPPVPTDSVAKPVPWGTPESVVALLVGFLVQNVAAVFLYYAWRDGFRHHQLLFGILAYQGLTVSTIVVVLVLIRARFHLPASVLGFRWPGWRQMLASLSAVPVVFIGVAVLYFLFTTLLPGYHLQGNAKQILGGSSAHMGFPLKVLVVVWAGVEAPLTEELLFRGVIFQGLRHSFGKFLPYIWAVPVAALVDGLVFGGAHFEWHTFPILAFLGIVLAYVFQTSRTLYASALIHGIINTISVISLLQ